MAGAEAALPVVRACIDGKIGFFTVDGGSGLAAVGETGGDINFMYPGLQKTLLHLAVEWDRLDVATWLVDHGADPELPRKVD